MQTIKIPRIYPCHNKSVNVVAIEGANGAGKTTLFNRFKKEHNDITCTLCVPDIYQTAKEMKHFMLFDSSALCSALYYLGGAVEVYENSNKCQKMLLDRSIWSTFAALYAKNEGLLPELFECLNVIKNHVFIPNLIVLLDAKYETCKTRSSNKIIGGEFDKDERNSFDKKRKFFDLLIDAGYIVETIDVNDKNTDEVYTIFKALVSKVF